MSAVIDERMLAKVAIERRKVCLQEITRRHVITPEKRRAAVSAKHRFEECC